MNSYEAHSKKCDTRPVYSSSAGMILPLSPSSADPLSRASLMCNHYWFAGKEKIYEIKPVLGKMRHQGTSLDLNVLTPGELELYRHNMKHREAEPEDALLVASGVLHKLLVQAEQEPPTENWERELAEL